MQWPARCITHACIEIHVPVEWIERILAVMHGKDLGTVLAGQAMGMPQCFVLVPGMAQLEG